ncbi:MAG: MFS transporter [Thermomicrobiales bacterium]
METAGKTALTRQQLTRRNIRLLFFDMSWQGLITAGIGTFISVFLVRLGASPLMLGLLTALPALVTIVLSVPLMPLIERRNDLVRVVTITRIGSRGCFLFIALVPFVLTGDRVALIAPVVVAFWGLSAVFSSATTPAFTAVLAEVVPPRERPRVNGGRWAAYSLVTAVCVAAMGWMLDLLSFPGNFQLVFGISVLAGFVSLAAFDRIRMPERAANAPRMRQGNPLRYFKELGVSSLKEPAFSAFLVTTFVYRLGLSLPIALYPLYWVNEVGASNAWIGYTTTASYGTLVVAYFLWGRYAPRIGSRRVLLIASFGLSFYPLLTPLVREPIWLIPVAFINGAFAAGIDISFFEGLLEASPPEHRASFAAVNASVANLAIFVGPILGTTLSGWVGLRVGFLVAGAFCLIGTALFYWLAVGSKRATRTAMAEG